MQTNFQNIFNLKNRDVYGTNCDHIDYIRARHVIQPEKNLQEHKLVKTVAALIDGRKINDKDEEPTIPADDEEKEKRAKSIEAEALEKNENFVKSIHEEKYKELAPFPHLPVKQDQEQKCYLMDILNEHIQHTFEQNPQPSKLKKIQNMAYKIHDKL